MPCLSRRPGGVPGVDPGRRPTTTWCPASIQDKEEVMKYLCLVYCEESKLNALSRDELQNLVDESLDNDKVMRRNGHYISSNALQSVQMAATVRVRNGTVVTTDGPFAETK